GFALTRCHAEVVEVHDGVRDGGDADAARPGEGAVSPLDYAAVIDVHLEAAASGDDFQDAPRVHRDLVLDACHDRRPAPVLDAKHGDSLVHRVGAEQVIVVLVEVAPDQAAALVLAAGDRLDTDAEVAVAQGDAVEEREGV